MSGPPCRASSFGSYHHPKSIGLHEAPPPTCQHDQKYDELDRGLLIEGSKVVESQIEVIRFDRDPTPVMTLTLHYYHK
jgi:hypothetical protein